jgi:hypothetical protein
MTLGRRPSFLIGGVAVGAVLTLAATLSPAQADATSTPGYDTAPTTYCGNGADISGLTTGQELHGWTVVQGSTPVEVTAHVLGVLKQGIDPHTDLVIVDVADPTPGPGEGDAADMTLPGNAAVERAGGVWEGMSGTPFYDASGNLVGALSYGLATGPSHVIGLTPYSSMQQYVAPTSSVPVTSAAIAKRIATAADTTQADAARGFTPLAVPTSISGISSQRLSRAAKAFRASGKVHTSFTAGVVGGMAASTTAAGSADPASPALTGGDDLGAADVWGDVVEGGIGTVTAVCGPQLVAYGHPQDDTGTTTDALTTASALGVQDDPLGSPFTIANFGTTVGEITGDHTTGINGTLGSGPADAGTFTGTATYDGGTPVTLTSHAANPSYWADASYYDLAGAADVATQAMVPGGATVKWTITGADEASKAFTLTHSDRFADTMDVADDAGFDLGNLVYAISGIPDVHVSGVTASMAIDDQDRTWRLTEVEQKVLGHWTKASAVVARAGHTLALRGVLEDKATGATRTVAIRVPIKSSLSGSRGIVQVTGGNSVFSFPDSFATVDAAKAYVAKMVPHDALQVVTALAGGHAGKQKTTSVTAETGDVVGGSKMVEVIVR